MVIVMAIIAMRILAVIAAIIAASIMMFFLD